METMETPLTYLAVMFTPTPLPGFVSVFAHVVLFVSLIYAAIVDARTRLIPLISLLAPTLAWICTAVVGVICGQCLFVFADRGLAASVWIAEGVAGGVLTAGFAFACALPLECRSGNRALGGGDVKLLFVIGLFYGPPGGIAVLAAACVFALLWQMVSAVVRLIVRMRDGRLFAPLCRTGRYRRITGHPSLGPCMHTFAFAPFIAVASLLLMCLL